MRGVYFLLALMEAEFVEGRKCAVSFSQERPLGLNCVRARVRVGLRAGERRVRRCLEGTARELAGLRARTAVFAEGFPYREFFLARGVREAGCGTLLAAKAAEIVRAAAPRHERALLRTDRADRRSLETARGLCRDFRYLALDAPEECLERFEDVCGGLGVAPEPYTSSGPGPDAAVFLSPPREPVFLPGRCVKLPVYTGGAPVLGGREVDRISFSLPEELRFDLPFPASPILSAALEAGTVEAEDVSVRAAGKGVDTALPPVL